MFKYSINIIWSDEDNGYIATVPEFPNLSVFGETYENALREAKTVVEGYIETLEEEKLPIPAPNKLVVYSGQTRIRMPKVLHQRLAEQAERQAVSLNTYMVSLLSMNYNFSRILPAPKECYILVYYSSEGKVLSEQRNFLPTVETFQIKGGKSKFLPLLNQRQEV